MLYTRDMPKGIKGFQKGHPPYLIKHSEESKQKMSKAQKGRPYHGMGFQKGHGAFRTAEEYRNEETRKKLSEATTRQMSDPKYKMQKEKNFKWKGEEASYYAFHIWLFTNFGKANKCENPECKYPRKNKNNQIIYQPKRFHWALIHGKEHGHFRENYFMLCASCHKLYDMDLISIY